MEQITILVEDKPGALADICEAFGRSGINIKSISAEGLGEAGIIRIITEDMNTAKRALEREGYSFSVSEIVPVRLMDRPGELGKVARKLADEGINIQCMYILGKDKGMTDIALRVSDVKGAKKALGKYLI
ncbi:MAG: ACT domain-containing protein [Candidatus Hydrothermarchaeales archaeon]